MYILNSAELKRLCTWCAQTHNQHHVHYLGMSNRAETVKARGRQQSPSLDLTVLSSIRDEYEVNAGDVFRVETEEDSRGRLVIKYTRVFAQADE